MTELPEITDKDRAVAEEALRLCKGGPNGPAAIAAALVRTGWRPVDPDLILARECVASVNRSAADDGRYDDYIRDVERGVYDPYFEVKIALAAIKAADARRQG